MTMNILRAILGLTFMIFMMELRLADGVHGPNCQSWSYFQLLPRRKTFIKNTFSLTQHIADLRAELERLRGLNLQALSEETFCGTTIGAVLSLASPTQWESSLFEFSTQRMKQIYGNNNEIIHNVFLTSLNPRGSPAQSTTSTTTAPVKPRRGRRSVDTGQTSEDITTTTSSPPSNEPEAEDWRDRRQLVCIINHIACSGQVCRNVLTRTIEKETRKPSPSLDQMTDGLVYFLTESEDGFHLRVVTEELSSTETEDEARGNRGCFVTQRNLNFENLLLLEQKGQKMLKEMLEEVNLFSEVLDKFITRTTSCETTATQLLACQALSKNCEKLNTADLTSVGQFCIDKLAGLVEKRRSSRNFINFLLYDHAKSLDDTINSLNVVNENQQILNLSFRSMQRQFNLYAKNLGESIISLMRDVNQLGLKLFESTALLELKKYISDISDRRKLTKVDLRTTFNRFKTIGQEFRGEMLKLISVLRGENLCNLSGHQGVGCLVKGSVVGIKGNAIVVGGDGHSLGSEQLTYIKCLPYKGQLSILNGKLWMTEGDLLIWRNISVKSKCLTQEESLTDADCKKSLVPFNEDEGNVRLLETEEEPVYILPGENGVMMSMRAGQSMEVKLGEKTIKLTDEPVYLEYSSLPIELKGKTIQESDMRRDYSNLYDLNQIVGEFDLENYLAHFDIGLVPEGSSVAPPDLQWSNFRDLIENSPVVQSFSGLSVGLMMIIAGAVVICCIKSPACRRKAKVFCCFCCDLSKLWTRIVEKFEDERNALYADRDERASVKQNRKLLKKMAGTTGRSIEMSEEEQQMLEGSDKRSQATQAGRVSFRPSAPPAS